MSKPCFNYNISFFKNLFAKKDFLKRNKEEQRGGPGRGRGGGEGTVPILSLQPQSLAWKRGASETC